MKLNNKELDNVFILLSGRLRLNKAPTFYLIVCGGSALIAANLISRTTKDVDIVALSDNYMNLIDPEPLPEELLQAAKEVADTLGLSNNWLNNGPSKGEGGIFRLGLPAGLAERCTKKDYGEKLKVYFIGRLDQIYFKFYAAVDQLGGYHADDLTALKPTEEELIQAAKWSMTHDPSEGYKLSIKMFLEKFGYEHIVDKL